MARVIAAMTATSGPRAMLVPYPSACVLHPDGHRARDPRGHAPAAVLARPGLEAPAPRSHALAQPAQAVARPEAGEPVRVPCGVVDDLDVDRTGAPADEHVHRRPRRVAQR